jgi:hypothetical protein
MMKKTKIRFCLGTSMFLLTGLCYGQDDLMKMLEKPSDKEKEYTQATFNSTRLIHLPTVETLGKRTLDFRINHRFGEVNGGPYTFFGLDGGASIRLALEYSYDGRLMFGVGRTSIQKMFDFFAKYRLFRQTTDNAMPVSVTLMSSVNINTLNSNQEFVDRLSFVNEIIIGRKFNENFSVQIAPTLIHFNTSMDLNDIYALGMAARYKVSKSVALTAEYAYRINEYTTSFNKYYNTAGIGFDLETGGHVFQVHFTNSLGLNEAQLIPYTDTRWLNGGIRLGFNISRAFTL